MSAKVVTAKMLETAAMLRPDDVVEYLLEKGWVDSGAYGPDAQLYRLNNRVSSFEAVIPTKREVSDFEWRVIDLIGLLAEITGTDTDFICTDLLPVGAGNAALRIQNHLNRLISDAKSQDLEDLARVIELALMAIGGEAHPLVIGGRRQATNLAPTRGKSRRSQSKVTSRRPQALS